MCSYLMLMCYSLKELFVAVCKKNENAYFDKHFSFFFGIECSISKTSLSLGLLFN